MSLLIVQQEEDVLGRKKDVLIVIEEKAKGVKRMYALVILTND
jgi:hypothetical protein